LEEFKSPFSGKKSGSDGSALKDTEILGATSIKEVVTRKRSFSAIVGEAREGIFERPAMLEVGDFSTDCGRHASDREKKLTEEGETRWTQKIEERVGGCHRGRFEGEGGLASAP